MNDQDFDQLTEMIAATTGTPQDEVRQELDLPRRMAERQAQHQALARKAIARQIKQLQRRPRDTWRKRSRPRGRGNRG